MPTQHTSGGSVRAAALPRIHSRESNKLLKRLGSLDTDTMHSVLDVLQAMFAP